MFKKVLIYPYYFFISFLPNHLINKVPFYFLRHLYYRNILGIKIGKGSSIHMNTRINRSNIKIGANSVINRNCYLDGRGGLVIGDNVSISPEVHLITASHDPNSPHFDYVEQPISIEDFVWIGSRSTILPGVSLGKGCVVATGAVVSKNVDPYTIVGGIPARKIGIRNNQLDYNCRWMPPFD